MSAYGLNVDEVLDWTLPQIRLLSEQRSLRVMDERRFALMLQTGTIPPEMWDQLWWSLGGHKLGLTSPESPGDSTVPSGKIGQQNHSVDAEGNVLAPGAPLLSDIALGKARPPVGFHHLTVVNKSAVKEE